MNLNDLKARIAQAKQKKDRATRAYNWLVKQCPHKIVCDRCNTDTTSEECIVNGVPDDFGHGGAQCMICERRFEWYCPKSPDRTCYYFSDGREGKKVILSNGTVVDLDESHHNNGKYESDDFCLFCGQPEERK